MQQWHFQERAEQLLTALDGSFFHGTQGLSMAFSVFVLGLCGIQGSGAKVDTEDAQGQGLGTGEPSPVRKSFLQACRGDRFLRTGHESDVVPWVLERLGQASATAGIQTL